ncbi:MAG: nucleotide exchange factor GrpE [Lachnospiraceae bacterium]|nr:nucleotide exchange factor GrpE [Lachnospiraceae bacterium]
MNQNMDEQEENTENISDGETSDEKTEGADDVSAESEESVEDSAQEEDTKEAKETSKESKKEKKKKEKTDKKQEVLKEKIDELEDRVKRQMAEFDNFRKRTEKEKSAMFETGAKSVIEKILPVVDNFERGLASVPEEEKGSAFAQGMEMIYKQLMTELEAINVKPIEAVGQEFNPDFHNAVMQVESEEYESGIVAQELQKGYTYRDSVVRHSMVAVVE